MKQNSALTWLVPLVAVLGLLVAGMGLFSQGGDGSFTFRTIHGTTVEMYGEGLYRNDSLFVGALFRGTDVITMFVGLPLLLAGYWLYLRTSLKGTLFLIGTLLYFLYIGVTYTFSAIFNPLFLVYTALFSTSLYATIIALTTFPAQLLMDKAASDLPRRGILSGF